MPNPTDLSVQLYTVRSALAIDLDDALARLAAIGFRRVEPFSLLEFRDRLRDSLPRHGLTAPTAHASFLGDDAGESGGAAAVFDAAAELGIGTVIQPWLDPVRWQGEDGIHRIADDLNDAASSAAALGLRVGYHNHHFELETRFGDRHALEVLADHLAPEVVLQVDTYWAMAGGADVPALLRRLGGRVAALHLKDGDGSLDPKRQVPLGQGRLPLEAILSAGPEAALRVVELDDTTGDLFDAVRIGRELLLELVDA